MEKNNLYKSISLNSIIENNTHLKTVLSPRYNNIQKTSLFKKPKKIKISSYNKTTRNFPKLSTNNNTPRKYKNNIQKIIPSTSEGLRQNNTFKITPRHIKELSVSIFQNNDIDLVRSLNPDSNTDLCSNLMLKEKLKNKIESNMNISLLFNSKKKQEGRRQYLQQNKKISLEGILESERKIKNDNKELFQNQKQNKQINTFEKDLNKKLKQLKEISELKKINKIKIYENLKNKIKEIDNIGYDIQLLNCKSNDNTILIKRDSMLLEKNNKRRRRTTILRKSTKNINYNEIINYKFNHKSHNNLDKFELSNINQHKHIINNNNTNEHKTEKNENNRLSVIQNLYQETKKKEFYKRIKMEKIGELKKEIKQMKIPLKSLNIEIGELKNVTNNIKEKLVKHYQELLYNGKEIRNEGLVWIIKAIWKLGENVPMSFMPTFLDLNGINYLFNMARLSIELETKKKYIIELKTKLKNEVNNLIKNRENENKSNNINNESNDDNNKNNKRKKRLIFKTDLLFKNKELTHSSSQPKYMKTFYHLNKEYNINMKSNLINDDNEEFFKGTFKEISKIFEDNCKDLICINFPEVNNIKNLEKKVKQIENDIKIMKKNEIKRIFKEFIDNDYENKYNTSIDVVLGALFGEKSRNIQVNNFYVFKKGHFDEIKNIRFYEFEKRNGLIS